MSLPSPAKSFLPSLLLAALPMLAGASTTINTVPEGMLAVNLAATGSGQNLTSYLSLPLTGDPTYAGAVSAVTATSISVGDATPPFTSGGLAAAAAPYFVKFLSGTETGRTIRVTANTTSSLTLDTTDNTSQTVSLTTSGFSVAVGDTFEVLPGDTLATLFGTNTGGSPLLLNGGSALYLSDTVGIYSTALLRTQAYYFNTTAGFWELNGSAANVNNTIIYPNSGFTITRRASEAATTLYLTGRVPEVAALTKTPGSSAVIYSSTGYPTDMKLSQLQFGSNWAKGSSIYADDTVAVWDSALLRFDTYYQLSDSTWRKLGSPTTDESSFVIPAGTELAILKRSAVSGSSSFLTSTLPYTLN